jgi:hypothetical protein
MIGREKLYLVGDEADFLSFKSQRMVMHEAQAMAGHFAWPADPHQAKNPETRGLAARQKTT